MANPDRVRLTLQVSPELDSLLAKLAEEGNTTKSGVLRKALALFNLAAEAKASNKRLAILNQQKQLELEIVGI